MGWDQGWVVAFSPCYFAFREVECDRPSLIFLENFFLFLVEIDEASVLNVVHVQQLLSQA